MKILNTTPLRVLLILGITTLAVQASAQTAERDTISREMVLEREYVPTAKQAKKTFFNPLADTKSKAMKPLEFARNTYDVSMNVRPHLFNPVENSRANLPADDAWHIRIFGGYPVRYGANLGMLYKVGNSGSVEMAIDHQSRDIAGIMRSDAGYVPRDKTHDTSLGLKYTGKLEDRLFSIGLHAFNNMHTMYGRALSGSYGGSVEEHTSNPFYRMTGAQLRMELAPAPVALLSPWQYSLYGNVGYTNKQDVRLSSAGMVPEDPRHALSGVDLELGGNLAYGLMSYNLNVGVDALLAGNQLMGVTLPDGTPASQYMSIDPYLSYVVDGFSLKAGARLQLLSFGPRKFLVAPRLQMKWHAHEMFAVIAEADGGARINSIRDLYRTNRYAQGISTYFANDIEQYRAMLGIQVGNVYGFSAEVRGGYADLLSMYHWSTRMDSFESRTSGALTERLVYFMAEDRGRVANFFLSAGAMYISPLGIQGSLGLKYNHYTRKIAEGDTEMESTRRVIAGRPTFELAASVDYQITPSLTAHLNFSGLSGIKFITPDLTGTGSSSEVVSLPFIADLDARLSYKLHRNVGLSLSGLNLLNQRGPRWLSYPRPGMAILGAVTFNL